MGQFGMGQAVKRVEDLRLLRGQGCYTEDITVPRQAYLTVVRSPYAHAEIKQIDIQTAQELPAFWPS